jgi:hypothetical protein
MPETTVKREPATCPITGALLHRWIVRLGDRFCGSFVTREDADRRAASVSR